ncbi:hypothetical protein [Saccharospirillum mangrovi]|uniref:hypothetical protein n=1 Tax=Saccharospirillum mangrovi TaxID=2161747 RepID=UPI001300AE04|nr:hypothetical protein [Saccharospirillum mangrovi]
MLRPLYRFAHRRRHPLAAALLIWVLWSVLAREDAPSFWVLNWGLESGETSPGFIGVAIDAAMLTGGEWWAGEGPPRPVNLADDELLRWARLLQPAWVRLGGTEADRLWWRLDDEPDEDPSLSRADIIQFLAFVDNLNARPMLTVSTGPRVRDDDGDWQPEQLERLLDWLPSDYNGILEFGNEPGAHWLMFGPTHQIGFDQYSREFVKARGYSGTIPLAGPANAFWPEVGEPLSTLVGSSREFLESGANPAIFTWHYYPTQSRRCTVRTEGAGWESLLDVEAVTEFAKQSRKVRAWVDRYSPETQLWLGETGPAQCGGVDQLTNRFGASLWWLTQLGLAARTGQETVIRQSLMGGDYALLAYRNHYSPNPDYWAQLLWQRLMGPRWLAVTGADGPVQAFAHCTPDASGALTLLTVNLSDKPMNIRLPLGTDAVSVLTVTSTALDSRLVQVNGQLPETLDWSANAPLPWQPLAADSEQPPHSYRFSRIDQHTYCAATPMPPGLR